MNLHTNLDLTGFLQFQLLFLGFFPAFWLSSGAVLGISAVSATFSRLFSGFLAEFGSCFGDFCSFSYFFSAFFRLFGLVWGAVLGISAVSATFSRLFSGFLDWFGELFWGFLQFQLLFLGFSPAFWLGLGSCFGDFCSFSYFLPVFLRLFS